MIDPEPHVCLGSAAMVDSAHADVAAFAARHAGQGHAHERAVALYYAVRDGFRYDPYRVDLSPEGMRASSVIAKGYGWCIPKAALLAAAARVSGIPARLGFSDVRNHLSTERMRRTMNTDVFEWHGYTELWLDGRWTKATPAFNVELCERFALLPLEFDGLADSIYHPFDKQGNRHMEYLRDRGSYVDIPLDQIRASFRVTYGEGLWGGGGALEKADFLDDVGKES